ncbi:lipocalin family protein [Chryseobacterium salipaludis]|uniref:lipocalin family protein n=1 Tax=Chryseobacterium TaxID=59732 RepID=UPI001FF207B3|nr:MULTISPECIES: lipocalin family protein [Chryseobacterium]MCJ8498103.1 lipocalin family protein [Chryseobacterium salipaludis]MCX3296698.1 lipocalin family protein [Planobacterium sp. JC490]
MKKVLLTGILGSAVLMSCSTAKTAQSNRADFLKMKGDWEITSVNYDRNYKVKPFDEGADAQCFVGSHWRLIPNNWSGSYTLTGGGACPSVVQPIKFEVVNGNEFRFKKMLEGSKAKAVTEGYSLNLVSQTTDQFSLEQNVPANGEMVRIVYNFERTSMR